MRPDWSSMVKGVYRKLRSAALLLTGAEKGRAGCGTLPGHQVGVPQGQPVHVEIGGDPTGLNCHQVASYTCSTSTYTHTRTQGSEPFHIVERALLHVFFVCLHCLTVDDWSENSHASEIWVANSLVKDQTSNTERKWKRKMSFYVPVVISPSLDQWNQIVVPTCWWPWRWWQVPSLNRGLLW